MDTVSRKFPDAYVGPVNLNGPEGNTLVLLGKATTAMRQAGVDKAEIDALRDNVFSGDYENALKAIQETVDISYIRRNEDEDEQADDEFDDDEDWTDD